MTITLIIVEFIEAYEELINPYVTNYTSHIYQKDNFTLEDCYLIQCFPYIIAYLLTNYETYRNIITILMTTIEYKKS